MSSDLIDIHAIWDVRRESIRQCAERLSEMLNRFADIHQALARLGERPERGPALPYTADVLAPLFGRRYSFDAAGRRRANGWVWKAGCDLPNERAVTALVFVGAHRYARDSIWLPNWVSIIFNTRDDGIDDCPMLMAIKPMLRAVILAWEPELAGAFSTRFRQMSQQQGERWRFSCGSSMMYLSASRAEDVRPPAAAIVETLPTGFLMLATEEPFSIENPCHLAAATAIHKAVEPI